MTQENIERLGILEQNLSSLVAQRQAFQKQILEINHAQSEIKGSSEAYEIVGTVMIKKPTENIEKSLEEKKNTASIKLESIQKQEMIIREELTKLQNLVMSELKQGE